MTDVMRGVRILEVAEHTFVPAAGALLSDWGADVVKIEHVERGDASRGLDSTAGVNFGRFGVNVYMEHANRGKRSIGLDLATPDGQELLHRLIERSDVFLTNKLPKVRQKLRIDVDDVRAHNPNIIYVRGTGYGTRGPDADRGGYDYLAYWGRAGHATSAQVPEIDYLPGQYAPGMGDSVGGMTIAGGISAALFHRERTGEAAVVDVSLLGTGLWAIAAAIALSQQAGEPLNGGTDRGNDGPRNPLTGNYRASDGRWLAFSMLQGFEYWAETCDALGVPQLARDPRFATPRLLFDNGHVAAALLEAHLATQPRHVWMERLRDVRGPWAPVNDVMEVLDDPMVQANGYIGTSTTARGIDVSMVTSPVQFDEQAIAPGRSPDFNEHGDEILNELGLDYETIIDLKLKGIVA